MGRNHKNRKKKQRKKKVVTSPKIEIKMAQFLDCMNLSYQRNKKIGRYNVDFLVEGKLIVECYGDYWHCNPQRYSPTYFNRGLKCEAQVKWDKDEARKQALMALGYRFLALWENEVNNAPKCCKSKIKQHLNGHRS